MTNVVFFGEFLVGGWVVCKPNLVISDELINKNGFVFVVDNNLYNSQIHENMEKYMRNSKNK